MYTNRAANARVDIIKSLKREAYTLNFECYLVVNIALYGCVCTLVILLGRSYLDY